jgi:hypothetical protein
MSDLVSKQSISASYSDQKAKYKYNVFVAYCGGFRFRFNTTNVRIIKEHINRDVLDQKVILESRKIMEPIDEFKGIHTSCIRYSSGYCWWNGHLSRNERNKLKKDDIVNAKSIIEGLKRVNPMPFNDLKLFHAFDFCLKYNDSKWKIGSMINFSFFLSKTLSWKVASFFANQSGKFYQKYLVCKYTQPGSKHICLNPPERKIDCNDGYEYLSFGEAFRFVEKIYQLDIYFWYFLPVPTLRVYYVMEYVGNDLDWKKDQHM